MEHGVVLVSNRRELQRLMGNTVTWEQNNSENINQALEGENTNASKMKTC